MALNLTKFNEEKKKGKLRDRAILQSTERKIEELVENELESSFTFILVDESLSMRPYAQNVAKGYEIMIDNLRSSNSTKQNVHFITLAAFAKDYRVIQESEKLSLQKGKDKIVTLKVGQPPEGNYFPDGITALYDCLYEALNSIIKINELLNSQGLYPKFNIALISDGEDVASARDPKILKDLMLQLRESGTLNSSVVLGLLDKSFTQEKLNNIKNTIGFESAIRLEKDDLAGQSSEQAKKMRRAFKEASQIN